MGDPHFRWIIYCVMAVACKLTNCDYADLLKDEKHHPHDYSTNMWWQLMNKTVYEGGEKNCYICAHMPYATYNSGLRPGNVTTQQQPCLYGLSTHPGTRKWKDIDYSSPLSNTIRNKPINGLNCSPTTDVLPLPQMTIKLPELITLAGMKPQTLGFCIFNDGTTSMGFVPWNLCEVVYTFCDKTTDFSTCSRCVTNSANSNFCRVWTRKTLVDCKHYLQQRTFNISRETREHQETTVCSAIVPGAKGSCVLTDWYFVCGHRAYIALPPNWGGLCALVPLTSPMFILRRTSNSTTRKRRSPMPEVQRWGGLTISTGIPWEFKIWGRPEKFFQGLFPWVGVGEVRDHVEINRYALLRLINDTYKLANSITNELTRMREMILQNRFILDLLTASQGGVCKIIGSAHCTFIPDEFGTGGDIHDALTDLEQLKHYVENGTQGARPFDLWSWLTSGPWWHLLLKICTPILVVLILFFILTSCILPCIKKMMMRSFTATMINLQMDKVLNQEETEEDHFLTT